MTKQEAENFIRSVVKIRESASDEQALESIAVYPAWRTTTSYAVNDRVRCNESLYRCVQAHTSQDDWLPDAAPALWVKVSIEEWPEWVQPSGAHDAYNKGDKVTYNGKRYICTADANVYAPGVYGWSEV